MLAVVRLLLNVGGLLLLLMLKGQKHFVIGKKQNYLILISEDDAKRECTRNTVKSLHF